MPTFKEELHMNQISSIGNNSTVENTGSKTKTRLSGKTIGSPELSEKAAKYYEELKSKYSNMDFILVSKDQKEQAQAQAGSYANASKMVVLIDEEKIERMAEDETYRKQYEGIIANAASGMSQLAKSISTTGAKVKGFGMQVKDNGLVSFFAVLEKSSAAQKTRIEKKAAEKKEAKKTEEKRAEKKKREEQLKETDEKADTVTVTAGSIEELIRKIQDAQMADRSDSSQTEEEKQVGQKIDFSV